MGWFGFGNRRRYIIDVNIPDIAGPGRQTFIKFLDVVVAKAKETIYLVPTIGNELLETKKSGG